MEEGRRRYTVLHAKAMWWGTFVPTFFQEFTAKVSLIISAFKNPYNFAGQAGERRGEATR